MDDAETQFQVFAQTLLKQSVGEHIEQLTPLSGGRNNRVYRLDTASNQYLLKRYNCHQNDKRDRLKHEWDFLNYTHQIDCQYVPETVAVDKQNKIAIYQFIEGRKLHASEMSLSHIKQAISFISQLNEPTHLPLTNTLPAAAEACLSHQHHINTVRNRVGRFQMLTGDRSSLDMAAKRIVDEVLLPMWHELQRTINEYTANIDTHKLYEQSQLCISPSDFGFHNALVTQTTDGSKEDKVIFIDFEYAGWDDPAKLISDFVCQPEIPTSAFSQTFTEGVLANCPKPDEVRERLTLFFPLHHLKWCFIMLNDFLPVDRERRNFALSLQNTEARQIEQLNKVSSYLEKQPDMGWL